MNYIDYIVSNYLAILIIAFVIIVFYALKSFVKKFTKTQTCPYCGSLDIERVQRSLFVKVLFFYKNVRKFKCLKCWNFFYFVSEKK